MTKKRDQSEYGGESVGNPMDPNEQGGNRRHTHTPGTQPDLNDPSKYGGESVGNPMDPGPQHKGPKSVPDANDPSRDGSG